MSHTTLGKRAGLVACVGVAALLCSSSLALAQTVGAAASYAVVGGQGVAVNGSGTIINGDVGVAPAAITSITGIPPNGANGIVTPPFSTFGPPAAAPAQAAVNTLYVSLVGLGGAIAIGPELSNLVLGPGTYSLGAAQLSNPSAGVTGILTLSGAGPYYFQVASSLTTGTLSNMVFTNGADPCQVFWQVTSQATINGPTFIGNVVAQAAVVLGTNVTLTGRALTTAAGAVTMAGNDTIGGCSGGTVNVTKTTIGGDGTFSFTGDLGPFDITTVGGTGTKTFPNVPPGPLSIAEIAPSGWTLTSNTCSSTSSAQVTAGGTLTCTVTNTKDVAPPTTIKVHILKYLNGATATATSAGGYQFPMVATSAFYGFTDAPYFLGDGHGGAPDLYGADTSPMALGANYTTSEVTGGSSLVLPIGGTCATGLYLLQGYSTSSVSLADAALQPITPGAPVFANLQADQYVIVWNHICEATGTLIVTKTSVGGVGTFNFTGGPNGPFSITTTAAGTPATTTFANVGPGPYTITETGPSGWTTAYLNCALVTVPAGGTATCAVVNTAVVPPQPGTLKVIKKTGNYHANGTFTFSGPNGTFTITTTNGTGTATIPNLPPGLYTVTETGLPPGWVQSSSTCAAVEVPAGLTVTCTIVNAKAPVCETTAPTVSVVSITPGPPVVVTLKVQDTGSGIQSIAVIVNTNAIVVVPPFTPGTTNPVYVTATKINQSQGSAVGLQVTDVCGNVTIFDPVTVTVNPGRHEAVMLTEVPGDETLVKIINDGIDAMRITVNGRQMPVIQLRRWETRIVDISWAMLPGDNNTIILEARGPNNGSAVVTVYPPPAASAEEEQARREHRKMFHKRATIIVLR